MSTPHLYQSQHSHLPCMYRSLIGHTGPVVSLAWRPLSPYPASSSSSSVSSIRPSNRPIQQLASSSSDQSILLWTMYPSIRCSQLFSTLSPCLSIDYSACGAYLAAGAADGTVTIWEPKEKGSFVKIETGDRDKGHGINCVEFNNDTSLLLCSSSSQSISLWRLSVPQSHHTGQLPGVEGLRASYGGSLNGHCGSVLSSSFSPDSRLIASGSSDCSVKIWDAERLSPLSTLSYHMSPTCINRVEWGVGGALVGAAVSEGAIKLWDTRSSLLVGDYYCGGHTAHSLSFHPNGTAVIAAVGDGTVKGFDLRMGTEMFSIRPSSSRLAVVSVAFDAVGKYFAVGGEDHRVGIYQWGEGERKERGEKSPYTGDYNKHTNRHNTMSHPVRDHMTQPSLSSSKVFYSRHIRRDNGKSTKRDKGQSNKKRISTSSSVSSSVHRCVPTHLPSSSMSPLSPSHSPPSSVINPSSLPIQTPPLRPSDPSYSCSYQHSHIGSANGNICSYPSSSPSVPPSTAPLPLSHAHSSSSSSSPSNPKRAARFRYVTSSSKEFLPRSVVAEGGAVAAEGIYPSSFSSSPLVPPILCVPPRDRVGHLPSSLSHTFLHISTQLDLINRTLVGLNDRLQISEDKIQRIQ